MLLRYLLLIAVVLICINASGQSILVLKPAQSMSVTGKGPGQDAALNPFTDINSIGVIENIGQNNFEIRIQQKGEIIKVVSVSPNEIKEVALLKGYELYLDAQKKSKAKVDFKKSTTQHN